MDPGAAAPGRRGGTGGTKWKSDCGWRPRRFSSASPTAVCHPCDCRLSPLESGSHSRYPDFYLLTFDPSRNDATITTLPIHRISGLCTLALSPNGSKLAIATSRGWDPSSPAPGGLKITVYTLAAGGSRSREGSRMILAGMFGFDLRWMSNGQSLGFGWHAYGRNALQLAEHRCSRARASYKHGHGHEHKHVAVAR